MEIAVSCTSCVYFGESRPNAPTCTCTHTSPTTQAMSKPMTPECQQRCQAAEEQLRLAQSRVAQLKAEKEKLTKDVHTYMRAWGAAATREEAETQRAVEGINFAKETVKRTKEAQRADQVRHTRDHTDSRGRHTRTRAHSHAARARTRKHTLTHARTQTHARTRTSDRLHAPRPRRSSRHARQTSTPQEHA